MRMRRTKNRKFRNGIVHFYDEVSVSHLVLKVGILILPLFVKIQDFTLLKELFRLRQEVKDWIESSEYDFETAKAMFKAGRYNYCIFMCHQAVEKLLKALIIFINKEFPPKTHNLIILLEEIDHYPDKEMQTIILKLNPHYMVSRYPDAAGGPSHKMYNDQIASEFLKDTEKVMEWLKQKMK